MDTVMKALRLGKALITLGFHAFVLRKDITLAVNHALAAHKQAAAEVQLLIIVEIFLCNAL